MVPIYMDHEILKTEEECVHMHQSLNLEGLSTVRVLIDKWK